MTRAKSNPQLVLRPQDVLVLLRLALDRGPPPSYAALGAELGLTASETHACVARAMAAQLAHKDSAGTVRVVREALLQFIEHGARYCFPAIRAGMTRGTPTAHAAAPLKGRVVADTDPVPVWPHAEGAVRGIAFYPLYPSVPQAAARNPALAELLVLFDGIRGGSTRERMLASGMLRKRLQP